MPKQLRVFSARLSVRKKPEPFKRHHCGVRSFHGPCLTRYLPRRRRGRIIPNRGQLDGIVTGYKQWLLLGPGSASKAQWEFQSRVRLLWAR